MNQPYPTSGGWGKMGISFPTPGPDEKLEYNQEQ
ncbi:hypothetical protein MICAER10613_010510 [Microcystis aeruginosa]